jgi:3-deoxy-7-phosphoheptulonate synthase
MGKIHFTALPSRKQWGIPAGRVYDTLYSPEIDQNKRMHSRLTLPKTSDLHVVETRPLSTPAEVKAEFPMTLGVANVVSQSRERIRAILAGKERALLVIVGPCSIHDVAAAREYAQKLVALRHDLHSCLEIVMRVYFEKPRTTIGWKGLINDPHLDGSFDINTGIRWARHLLMDIADMGLPSATAVSYTHLTLPTKA